MYVLSKLGTMTKVSFCANDKASFNYIPIIEIIQY